MLRTKLGILLTEACLVSGGTTLEAETPTTESRPKTLSSPSRLWDDSYQRLLLQRIGEKIPELASYPALMYPNSESHLLVEQSPTGKVLLFGYGSLISKVSAGRSVRADTLATMRPVVAFGVKRLFNYRATKTDHWGTQLKHEEKAMLNLVAGWGYSSFANGVVLEVDAEDLSSLVSREIGYDLVPILIANWDEVTAQSSSVQIDIAYAFVASSELRDRQLYTSTQFYPVRGYLKLVQEASLTYGSQFHETWNATTFLADGTTRVDEWDGTTFTGILSEDSR